MTPSIALTWHLSESFWITCIHTDPHTHNRLDNVSIFMLLILYQYNTTKRKGKLHIIWNCISETMNTPFPFVFFSFMHTTTSIVCRVGGFFSSMFVLFAFVLCCTHTHLQHQKVIWDICYISTPFQLKGT